MSSVTGVLILASLVSMTSSNYFLLVLGIDIFKDEILVFYFVVVNHGFLLVLMLSLVTFFT
jgi:hypothetical protein